MEKLLNLDEFCEITGLAKQTVFNRGGGTSDLTRLRLGRKIMFRESDVRQWLDRRTEKRHAPLMLPRNVRMIGSKRRKA